jgi:hypothetical protein
MTKIFVNEFLIVFANIVNLVFGYTTPFAAQGVPPKYHLK